MTRTLFVSDVHLRPGEPARNRSFLEFLKVECEELYLVGDLFDYWIGPKHLRSADYRGELAALREKAARSKLFFLHGNRDYFVDGAFERATGIKVLGDRARVKRDGRTVLLAHGDFIYNKNPKYTAYRTMMRSKPVTDLWLAMPAVLGKTIARVGRKVSVATTPALTFTRDEIVDGARPLFQQGADVLICGHIHAPRHVTFDVSGSRRDVYIMGDWCGGTQDYVEHDGRGFRFTRWPKGPESG